MTPEIAREMIPILEAIAKGVKVERRCEGEDWEPQVGTMILNDDWEFRIVPREFWLNTANNTIHDPKRPGGKHSCLDSRWVKVREIIE